MRRASLLAVTFLVAATSAAKAQESPRIKLDRLVVTGTPFARPLAELGLDVHVLDGEELRASGITRVTDALRDTPGVAIVESGSFGSIASLFMRGGESDFVQVLIDGVQINQPGGSFDFSGLTTENIERIEILRGPASALYGSDAMAGVIHIITKRGAGSPKGSLSFRAGSFGRYDVTADLSGGGDNVSYGFSVSRESTDGILAFNNDFRNTVLTGTVAASLDSRTDARVTTRVADREFHFPTDGSGNVVDQNQFSFGDELTFGLLFNRRGVGPADLELEVTHYERDGGTDDRPDNSADTLGFFGFISLDAMQRTNGAIRSNFELASSTTGTIGLEAETQSIRSFNESLSQFGPSTGESSNERWNRAAFGHVVSTIGEVTTNGGLRLESNERFGESWTWQVGAAVNVGPAGRVRGAAGRGIKEPTFSENFATGFATGNLDLKPEESRSWEVGADYSFASGAVRAEVTYFDQLFKDLIQFTFTPPEPSGPNYVNIAEVDSRGIESRVTVEHGPARVAVFLDWVDTEVVDSGVDEGAGATFVEGERLIRRPSVTIGGSGSLRLGSVARVNGSVRRVGDRDDRDFSSFPANPIELDPYTNVSLGVDLAVVGADQPNGFDLTLRAENLLNERYDEAFGFRAPGRGVYVGGRLRIGG